MLHNRADKVNIKPVQCNKIFEISEYCRNSPCVRFQATHICHAKVALKDCG